MVNYLSTYMQSLVVGLHSLAPGTRQSGELRQSLGMPMLTHLSLTFDGGLVGTVYLLG